MKISKNEIMDEIVRYFEENTDEFIEAIEELDSYNGYLGDDRLYDMDEMDELFSGSTPLDILFKAFNGYDEEIYIDERGYEHQSSFNPNRPYFGFSGYGNFVSYYEKDYSDFLDGYFIKSLCENRHNICYEEPDELSELLDKLEVAEEETED